MSSRTYAPHNSYSYGGYYGTPRTSRPSITQRNSQAHPASDKQIEYLKSLLDSRDLSGTMLNTPQAVEALLTNTTSTAASAAIDVLKPLPYKPRPAVPGSREVTEGMWVYGPEHDVAKVQKAVHGSGNLYAKHLDPQTGTFEYVPGLVRLLTTQGEPMTLEMAREFGHLYGMCCVCGATLTDEKSIEAGIGPVCATKF